MSFKLPTSDVCIIIDNGTHRTRVGFAGNKLPTFEVAPYSIGLKPTYQEPRPVYSTKTVKDFSLLESFYYELLVKNLNIEPCDQSYVITEPVFETNENRFRMLEMMFETFDAQKVALTTDAAMTLYSLQKASAKQVSSTVRSNLTGLVVDLGHKQSTIVPLVEGHIIENGIVRYPIHGEKIRESIKTSLLSKKENSILQQMVPNDIDRICDLVKEKCTKIIKMEGKPRLGEEKIKIEFQDKVQLSASHIGHRRTHSCLSLNDSTTRMLNRRDFRAKNAWAFPK